MKSRLPGRGQGHDAAEPAHSSRGHHAEAGDGAAPAETSQDPGGEITP